MTLRTVLIVATGLIAATVEAQTTPITLLWDDPPNAAVTGYNIYREAGRNTPANPVRVGSVAGTLRTYTEQAPMGIVLCYTVRSAVGVDESKPSNEACVLTISGPVNLRVQ